MVTLDAPPSPVSRSVAIDMARGLALCGMVAFHLKWDLNDWGWQDTGPGDSAAWMALGHGVAATFLFISGYCQVLAQDRGRWSALRRIGGLVAASVAVTLVTRRLFPDAFIFFGILHCIAVSSLIGLAFLGAPRVVTFLAAGAALALPVLASSKVFDAPQWWWLGLSTAAPVTLDYRPVLPWLAAALLGIAAARTMPVLPRIRTPAALRNCLAWAGRHSLAIYLAHQPLLFGIFYMLATIHPPPSPLARSAFGRECLSQCVAAGAGKIGCETACACVLRQTRATLSEAPTESDLRQASEICVKGDPILP